MTPEQIMALTGDSGLTKVHRRGIFMCSMSEVVALAKLIEAATRAECARVCRDMQHGFASDQHIECAEAIEGMK